MDGYPDPDEEFEAMYADELELLRENDPEPPIPKSKKSLKFDTPAKVNVNVLQNVIISNPTASTHVNNEDGFIAVNEEDDYELVQEFSQDPFNGLNVEQVEQMVERNSQPAIERNNHQKGNKRNLEELFGNIDDIMQEEIQLPIPKKLKQDEHERHEEELALIEHIIELRRLVKEKNDASANFGKPYVNSNFDYLRDNLSYSVPKYSSIQVTKYDLTKFYIRFHSELFEEEEKARLTKSVSFNNTLGEHFAEVWDEAQNILIKRSDIQMVDAETILSQTPDSQNLWVDLYKPRKYIELLSDESTNRILLRWLKLWDKIVFNRRPKILTINKHNTFQKQELNTELDEHGRPQNKIALLCGPPGLGKTTLAHMVAKHAGYKVVEINASDERSVDSFKTAIENSTQMSSVLDQEHRPNCLIFDEIDGAPLAAIDFLIKYVSGTNVNKSKKGKKQPKQILKRPIICICNDVYVPSLRSLRQISFVVHFPPTATARLTERLKEIAWKENIQINTGALIALSEKSNNDIRCCLSVLQFFKTQNKPVTLNDVLKANIGQKDLQKGLFSVWNEIFFIERSKNKNQPATLSTRFKKVYSTISSFGDYDRVAQGVFENYPKMYVKDSSFKGTCEALNWFCFSDILNKKINTTQNYALNNYQQYGFIVWHYVFGSFQRGEISYPTASREANIKGMKNKAIVQEVLKGMRPPIRAYSSENCIKIDILPLLIDIITPNIRPVNLHLYTRQEKELLKNIVAIMIDYNLNYLQERNQEGSYVFNLDPNIEELVKFSTSKSKRSLTYSNRQLIAREIELEKMRSLNIGKSETDEKKDKVVKEIKMISPQEQKNLPNHLQKLKPKTIKSSNSGFNNFFIKKTANVMEVDKDSEEPPISRDLWYEYKEGHTNAVRKRVKVSSWL